MRHQAKTLVELLKARGLTCATAESCTGGGVGSAITSVPGSSAVFYGADFEQVTIYTGLYYFIVASHIRGYDGHARAQCFDQ